MFPTKTVQTHYGEGGFNPFANPEMGGAYVLFNAFVVTACVLTLQPVIQRVLAAKDVKTGRQVFTRTSIFFACASFARSGTSSGFIEL